MWILLKPQQLELVNLRLKTPNLLLNMKILLKIELKKNYKCIPFKNLVKILKDIFLDITPHSKSNHFSMSLCKCLHSIINYISFWNINKYSDRSHKILRGIYLHIHFGYYKGMINYNKYFQLEHNFLNSQYSWMNYYRNYSKLDILFILNNIFYININYFSQETFKLGKYYNINFSK